MERRGSAALCSVTADPAGSIECGCPVPGSVGEKKSVALRLGGIVASTIGTATFQCTKILQSY